MTGFDSARADEMDSSYLTELENFNADDISAMHSWLTTVKHDEQIAELLLIWFLRMHRGHMWKVFYVCGDECCVRKQCFCNLELWEFFS